MGTKMDRAQLCAVLKAAPQGDDEARLSYFMANFGQLFGWISGGPDQHFLVNLLPKLATPPDEAPLRVLEIGTFLGSTARGLAALTGGGKVTSIDNMSDVHFATYQKPGGGFFTSAREAWENTLVNLGVDLLSYVNLIEGDSREIGPRWTEPVDLLLVDGAHDYPTAKADIENFAKWVIPGGHCLVDDTSMEGVWPACAEYFGSTWEVIRPPSRDEKASLACWRKIG